MAVWRQRLPDTDLRVRATLVTTAATPDDVVYFVVKSEFENFEEFKGPTRRSRISTGEKWHAQGSPPPLPSGC